MNVPILDIWVLSGMTGTKKINILVSLNIPYQICLQNHSVSFLLPPAFCKLFSCTVSQLWEWDFNACRYNKLLLWEKKVYYFISIGVYLINSEVKSLPFSLLILTDVVHPGLARAFPVNGSIFICGCLWIYLYPSSLETKVIVNMASWPYIPLWRSHLSGHSGSY